MQILSTELLDMAPRVAEHNLVSSTVVALYVGQTERIGVTQMKSLVGDATHWREGQRIAVA